MVHLGEERDGEHSRKEISLSVTRCNRPKKNVRKTAHVPVTYHMGCGTVLGLTAVVNVVKICRPDTLHLQRVRQGIVQVGSTTTTTVTGTANIMLSTYVMPTSYS